MDLVNWKKSAEFELKKTAKTGNSFHAETLTFFNWRDLPSLTHMTIIIRQPSFYHLRWINKLYVTFRCLWINECYAEYTALFSIIWRISFSTYEYIYCVDRTADSVSNCDCIQDWPVQVLQEWYLLQGLPLQGTYSRETIKKCVL